MSKALATTANNAPDKKEIELGEKFKKWTELYLDKSNKSTYLNATESAMQVYDCKNRHSANVIGGQNLVKLGNVRQMIADELGYTLPEMMKIGLAMMIKGGFSDWERMMQLLGHIDDPKHPGPNNNFQFNLNLGDAIAQSRKERGLDP